jgi:hypothetical protein
MPSRETPYVITSIPEIGRIEGRFVYDQTDENIVEDNKIQVLLDYSAKSDITEEAAQQKVIDVATLLGAMILRAGKTRDAQVIYPIIRTTPGKAGRDIPDTSQLPYLRVRQHNLMAELGFEEDIARRIRVMARNIPDEWLQTRAHTGEYRLGNIALTQRRASNEELSAYAERRKQAKIEAAQRAAELPRFQEVERLARVGPDFGDIITAKADILYITTQAEKNYALTLNTPLSYVAARAFLQLRRMQVVETAGVDLSGHFSVGSFAKDVLSDMSQSELAVVRARDTDTSGQDFKRAPIRGHVARFLSTIATGMGLVRSIGPDEYRYLPQSVTAVEFADPDKPQPEIAHVIQPPDSLLRSHQQTPSGDELTHAAILKDDITGDIGPLTDTQAIMCLDLLMSAPGRNALQIVCDIGVNERRQLHEAIRCTFGAGVYYNILSNRTISGNKVTGDQSPVVQLGGPMPARAYALLERRLQARRWNFR